MDSGHDLIRRSGERERGGEGTGVGGRGGLRHVFQLGCISMVPCDRRWG